MIEISVLAVFVPTFFFVSLTPGMCMTLALTLGMTIGLKRTLWMMAGELFGVGAVALAATLGVAATVLKYPSAFALLQYGGAAYLTYLGVQLWLSRGKMAIQADTALGATRVLTPHGLAAQGFVTAIANPKAWVFMVSLLPPFINPAADLTRQLVMLLIILLMLEFLCLLLYAGGGRSLRRFLDKSANVRLLNRLAGTLMMGVALWLVLA